MRPISPTDKLGGVLAPLFCLRGSRDLGVGDVAALREAIGWAAASGLRAFQILPVNEMGGDHSPYNIISSIAIDPTTIATTPGELPDLGEREFAAICARHDVAGLVAGPVDYAGVGALKRELLESAYDRFAAGPLRRATRRARGFRFFCHSQEPWLADYALYRAILDLNGGVESQDRWLPEQRDPVSARRWLASLGGEQSARADRLVEYFSYVQWVADVQWSALRDYSDRLGVALIGDVPVGVSLYGSDVWSSPGIFDLARSSGAPPEKVFKADPFTEQWGQNWGFPLYHWFEMSKDNFAWWRRRLRGLMRYFHLIRVDHALGFFRIYSFPWRPERNAEFLGLSEEEARAKTGGPLPGFVERDDSTEENRRGNQRHGEVLLGFMLEETGSNRLIAEDLGEVAPYVRPTLERMAIPGFKIPQWEREPDGAYTPGADYPRLSLATYATHDHPPVKKFWDAWFEETRGGDPVAARHAGEEMARLLGFAGRPDLADKPRPFSRDIHLALLEGLFASNSWLAIHMVTDLFGDDTQFNVPGSSGDANWTRRIPLPVAAWSEAHKETLSRVREMLLKSGRLGQE